MEKITGGCIRSDPGCFLWVAFSPGRIRIKSNRIRNSVNIASLSQLLANCPLHDQIMHICTIVELNKSTLQHFFDNNETKNCYNNQKFFFEMIFSEHVAHA